MAGRLFAAQEGVWKNISASEDSRMIRIEPKKPVEKVQRVPHRDSPAPDFDIVRALLQEPIHP